MFSAQSRDLGGEGREALTLVQLRFLPVSALGTKRGSEPSMNLSGKRVFVTGASSGIGAAIAQAFAARGAHLLLCARRLDRVTDLADALRREHGVQTHAFQLDVRDRAAVDAALDGLPEEFRVPDVLVNNAGLAAGASPLPEGDIEDWERMIDTNIKGLLYITRRLIPEMMQRPAQIINIGSIAGRYAYPNGAVYCATKAAVRLLTDGLRMDLVGTPVRVANIEPGAVETEFSVVRYHGDQNKADAVYAGIDPLVAADIAEIATFIASRPAHVQICDMVVTPTQQASAMVTHRRS